MLFVLSDHGFKSFQRGVNLNVWLLENGYLHLKNDAREGEPYLRDVDWSRTRAYVFGLAGVYINQKGREAQGIVAPGEEARALKKELEEKLTGLLDDERNTVAIQRAYTKESVYKGPLRRSGARCRDRLQRRLSQFLVGGDGHGNGVGFRGQYKGLERGPLRRSSDGSRGLSFAIASSREKIRESRISRRRRLRCSGSSPPNTWMATILP